MPNLQPLKPIARRALSAQSDERLVRLVREGHDPAFEEIVRRYRGPLVGFATAIVSANGAEDVVQASLAKAHSALRDDDAREINLRPWLFAIVRNGALNSVRGEPRVDELDEAIAAHSDPSEIAEHRDDLDRLVVAMCALPDAQRQALVKRELEGVGHGEIAAQLGTTATAVRGLIFRARTQLRNAVGALVPLPILRALLAQGTSASAAGAAGATGSLAGGGASAALLGGAGAKGGAVLAAAVLAFGSGIALEKRDRGNGEVDQASAATQGGDDAARRTSGTGTTSAAASAATEGGGSSHGSAPPQNGSGGSAGSDSGSAGNSGSSNSGPGSGSSGHSGGSGDDDGTGSQPPVAPPGDDDHSGHGGPGSGHDDEDDDFESPEPELDDDSSGPGNDHESETELSDDDGSSGPGDGDDSEESDDHSGHGTLQGSA